jgi:glutamate dehydrogenase (NAD(P)+)
MIPTKHNPIPANTPAMVIEYTDPDEGFKGWLVRDQLCHRLCAGGMRVQPGITRQKLIDMAQNMTLKMRIADLRVDGAKSGIDYDPDAPGKHAAIARFIKAIKPFIECCYSMGPDLNVEMDELEIAAGKVDIPSVKMAIARSQGWSTDYYLTRNAVLQQKVDGWSVNRLRAGYGVAAAVLAVLDFMKISHGKANVAIQGFGTLAKATAFRLYKAGVKIIGIADIDNCLVSTNGQGLAVDEILKTVSTRLDLSAYDQGAIKPSQHITGITCDILVPAAVENAITPGIAQNLPVKAVVPGANLAVPHESIQLFYERSILVLPDFLAGCGGSLSMEGLFGPADHPTPDAVLAHIETKMVEVVSKILSRSTEEQITPTDAALKYCAETVCQPDTRPYGNPGPCLQ